MPNAELRFKSVKRFIPHSESAFWDSSFLDLPFSP